VFDVVEDQDLNIGWLPDGLVRLPSLLDVWGPKSYCSQLYVIASPSESKPEAMSSNGVFAGIVEPLLKVVTVGIELFVDDGTSQEFPPPFTVKEIISFIL
jgi:hypothetical protein